MTKVSVFVRFRFKAAVVTTALCALILGAAASSPAASSKGLRVPQDYPTIQAAVNAAPAGAIIHVAPGNWCGATISTQVDLEGDGGATIIGCSSTVELFDSSLRLGFRLENKASGTTIRNFIFNGQGWSRTNLTPLAEGIRSAGTPNVISNVTIEHNQFLGGVAGIADLGGGNWLIDHNVFSGYSIDHVTTFGGYAISFQDATSPVTARSMDNEASYNTISTTVANGIVSSEFFIQNPDIAFAGVIADSQDGLILRDNKISIASNPAVADGGDGAGIIVGDFSATGFLTTINTVIFNNDGRGSAYALIIPLDSGGLTGNTAGAAIRGNFGVNLINSASTTVGNRSIQNALTCNSSGVCQ